MKLWIKLLGITILTAVFLTPLSLFSQSGSWWVKILDENNNQTFIYGNEFLNAYRTYIDFQLFMQPNMELEDESIYEDCEKQKAYLENYVNETLIIIKANQRGYYNEAEINDQIENFADILERMYILRQYSKEVVEPQIEVTQDYIDEVWEETQQRLREQDEDISMSEVEDYIVRKRKAELLQERLEELVDEFRQSNRINYNEAFDIPEDQEPDPADDLSWRVRIRNVDSGNIITITQEEFEDSYRGYLQFQLFLSAQMEMVDTDEFLSLLENRTQQDMYLRVYVKESILVHLAEQSNLNLSGMDDKIKNFSDLLRRMLIIQAYTREYIHPLISVSESEIDTVWEEKQDIIQDMLADEEATEQEIRDYLRMLLRNEKTMLKLKEMMDRYVEEYIIQYNHEFDC